ncbi:cytochrome P450 [Vararia minispora EC-137]|uniref:Cytochrome P450 n=1 Tax=Vararia minispora EC-137 TaxID=1314806 RepID=A0ACB8Q8C7_9AGAM|nr:cytochrome P450 [Vararia minispora EC-137]
MDATLLFSAWQRFLLVLPSYPLFSAVVCLLTIVSLAQRYLSSPWRRLPPGPRGYPLLGSALALRHKQRFLARCMAFGDVVYVNVAGQSTLIINSPRAAADLLDRHAAISSSRLRYIVAHELISGSHFMVMEGHTDRYFALCILHWRRMRRAMHEGFRPVAAVNYHVMEEEEAARLALALAGDAQASTPGAYVRHYAHYASSLLLAITYGRPLRDTDADRATAATLDGIIWHLERTMAPGSHLVEFFPWLLAIPARFAKWKREALEGHKRITRFYDGLIDDVKRRMAIGEAPPCLVRSLVEEKQHLGMSVDETAWTAGTAYTVGSETQAGTLEWITLVLAAHPTVQRRAQAALDAVVGHARAPRVRDRAQLPYITAVVREALRWRPPVPLGVPHVSDEDVWYEGMFIPKGTAYIVNMQACNADPDLYGMDAARFNPDRYLDEKGQLKPSPPDTKDEGHISYGFGRRSCVGKHVANDSLFVATATLLWAFDLSTVGPFDLDTYVDKGVTTVPKPFSCKFVSRFTEATAILTGELEAQ